MKPPFFYFGGKTRLAPWIVSLMPAHRVYLEPFAGSAAVLLAKPASKHEFINDLDDGVVTFYRCLRDRRDELVEACRLTPYARAEFEACADRDVADDIERARRWWCRTVQGFGASIAATGWSVSTSPNTSDASTAAALVKRMTAVAERLRGVAIEHRDAVEFITALEQPDALIYCDPPYLGSTRNLRRAGDYRHEFHTEDDHRQLADVLRSTPAAVLLSGYHSALYDELYDGWSRVERTQLVGTSRRRAQSRSAIEVVWSNRPIAEQLVMGHDALTGRATT